MPTLSHAAGGTYGQAMMLVSGASGPEEVCLTSTGDGTAAAENCIEAVQRGDGSDIWFLSPKGQFVSYISGKCLAGEGKNVEMVECTEKSDDESSGLNWQLRPDSRFQLGESGKQCLGLTEKEDGVGAVADAAQSQPAEASSNAERFAAKPVLHGPDRAVDGVPSTYWASDVLPEGDKPVALTVAIPESRLYSVDVDWEFPPKAFDLQLTANGKRWTTVYTVNRNPLHSSQTHILLKGQSAIGARLVMKAHDEVQGKKGPEAFFGVKSFRVNVPNYTPVIQDCKQGNKHAHDRWFPAAVLQFDPFRKLCEGPDPKSWKPNTMQADPSWLSSRGVAKGSFLETGRGRHAASFVETRENLHALTRFRSQHRRTLDGFLCSAAGVYDRKVFTGCYSGASPDGSTGREWCYVEPEVADGLPAPVKSKSGPDWGYCAQVIDYDTLRKADD